MRHALVKNPFLYIYNFGYDAYMQVSKENRSKIDNKDDKCIFIGYKYGIKGYKPWSPITKSTSYSRDFIFRDLKYVPKYEVQPREEELDIMEFELEGEESDSTK